MKKLQLAVFLLVLFGWGSAAYGYAYFYKIEGCILFYSSKKEFTGPDTNPGVGLLNLAKADEIKMNKTSIEMVFSSSINSLKVTEEQTKQIIDTYNRCITPWALPGNK